MGAVILVAQYGNTPEHLIGLIFIDEKIALRMLVERVTAAVERQVHL